MNVLIARVGMMPELAVAVRAVEIIGQKMLRTVFCLRRTAFCLFDLSLYLLKGIPVNDRFMLVLENYPVFLRVLDTLFVFEVLGIGLEIDYISAVFLLMEDSFHG